MPKLISRSLVRYFTPLVASVTFFLGAEIFFRFPILLSLIMGVLFLIHFLVIWQLVPKTTQARLILSDQKVSLKFFITFFKIITDKEFVGFLLPSLLLIFGSFTFIIFLPAGLLRHLVVLLVSFLSFLFFRSIFLYFFRPEEYQTQSLENISLYLSLLSFYFFSTGLLGLVVFADFLLWQALLALLLVSFLLTWQIFWFQRFETKVGWLYIFILCLVMAEFFWAINFLPLNFYVGGLLLTVVYYLFLSLSRRQLTGTLEKRLIWHYLLLSLAIIAIVLVTAEWR
jgi:hypothetical protein